MNCKKLLLVAVCTLIFGSYFTANVYCEVSRTTKEWDIASNDYEPYYFLLNSTYVVYGNITSGSPKIDFNLSGPEDSVIIWHNGTSGGKYNFSFTSEVQGTYTLNITNSDENATAHVKLVYFAKTLDESDFEEMRVALMNNYDSQTATHVGYIIALFIGIATTLSKLDFFTTNWKLKVLLSGILSSLVSAIIFFFIRISYWSSIASQVKVVTVSEIDFTMHKTFIVAIEGAAVKAYENVASNPGLESVTLWFKNNWFCGALSLCIVFFFIFLVVIFFILEKKIDQKKSKMPCLF